MTSIISFDNRQILHFKPPLGSGATLKHASYPGVFHIRKLFHQIAYQKDFVQRMRKFRFDLTIDLRTGTRGAILAFLSGARQRIGYYAQDNNLWRNRIFTRLSKIEYDPRQHVAVRTLQAQRV